MPNLDYLGNCKHEFVWRMGKLTGVLFEVCKHCCTVRQWGK